MTLWEKFSPDSNREADALAIQDGKIFRISTELVSAISDDYFNSGRWFAATTNRDENILSAVTEDRTKLVVQNSTASTPRRVIVEGQGFRIPHSDIFDAIWVTGVNQISVIRKNRVINVSIDGIDKQNVIDVIPSPDGVRALLITNTVYGTELRIGTIVRDDQSIKIINVRKLIRDGFSVAQATWQDSEYVLYLDNFSEPANIYSIDSFTGVSKSLYSQIGSRNLASVIKKPTYLTLEGGSILERISGEWISRGNFINASYPG
jgi:hypothetical protein